MRGECIVLMCAALVQIALITVSPTAAAFQRKDIDDIQLLRMYRGVSYIQLKKALEIFFPDDLQDYLTKAGLSHEYSNEDNPNGTEICANVILARGNSVLDATFAAALIADPKITSIVSNAHNSLTNGLFVIVRTLCDALRLAVESKGPSTVAEIQAIADKIVSSTGDWNSQFFNAARTSRKLQPEIALMIKEAETRSTDYFESGFNLTFNGMIKLASLNLETESEKILSTMETFRNLAYDTFVSSIKEKFDVAEVLFLAPPIVRYDEGTYVFEGQNETVSIKCESENATEAAALQIQKGVSAIFDTILRLTAIRNQNGYQNDSPNTVSAKEEASAVFNSVVDATLNGVLKINPKCSSIIEVKRDAAKSKLSKIIDVVNNGIKSIGNTNPGMIMQQFEATEAETIGQASGLVVDLFDGILSCVQPADSHISRPQSSTYGMGLPGSQHKSKSLQSGFITLPTTFYNLQSTCRCILPVGALMSPHCANVCANRGKSPAKQTGHAEIDAGLQNLVQLDQKRSIAKMTKLLQLIFASIKVRIMELSSGIQTEGKAILSSIQTAQTEASVTGKAAIQIVIDVIVTFMKGSTDNTLDKSATLSAIGVYRDEAMFKIQKGIDIIFSNIMANNENVPGDIANDIIETGRKAASVACSSGLEHSFCAFLDTDPGTILTIGTEALSQMQRGVDSIYDAIQETQGKNSCELLPKLEAMKATTIKHFMDMIAKLFDAVRQSPNYNIQMEPKLASTQNNSISNSMKATAATYNGIRTLASLNCPESQTSPADSLSALAAEYNIAASRLVNWSGTVSEAVTNVSPKNKFKIHNPFRMTSKMRHRIRAGHNFKRRFPFRNIL